MSAVGWALLEGLHLYRRRSEPRHVDRGPMRFYHVLGWGLPAFITGLAVGLDPEGYGNPDFCWLSIHDSLVWSLAGPIACAVAVSIFFLVLAARATCTTPQGFEKKGMAVPMGGPSTCLGCRWGLPQCVDGGWLAPAPRRAPHAHMPPSPPQGPLIFLFCVVLSKEVRRSLRLSCARRRGSDPALATKSTLTPPRAAGTGRAWGALPRLPGPARGYGHHVCNECTRPQPGLGGGGCPWAPPDLGPSPAAAEHDTDSDSDLSLEDDRSGSYGSTHSSESEDEAPAAGWDTLPGPPLTPPAPGNASLGGHAVGMGSLSLAGVLMEGTQWGCGGPSLCSGCQWGHPVGMGGPMPCLEREWGAPSEFGRGPSPCPGYRGHPLGMGGGSRVGGTVAPRPRQTLQEQLSGVTPIAMSIKAGTVDEDSSGSE
ncbi:CELR2 protein, partial [Fregata magnificens]|nr:CELR2 protein [Fregata magnificens]